MLYNDEFAVKVTEVNAGSPAARAGLRPGIVIIEANGKPVLHPNELDDAIRNSGKTCRLTIVDPGTGRKKRDRCQLVRGRLLILDCHDWTRTMRNRTS